MYRGAQAPGSGRLIPEPVDQALISPVPRDPSLLSSMYIYTKPTATDVYVKGLPTVSITVDVGCNTNSAGYLAQCLS